MRTAGTSRPGTQASLNSVIPLFTGAVLAVGTFPSMWPIVDTVFALLCVSAWIAGIRPPVWSLFLTGTIGISAVWSPVPIDGVSTAIRISALAFAGKAYLNGDRSDGVWLASGFIAGLAVQTLTLASVGWMHQRPPGLSLNAYILGEAGLTVFMLTAWRHQLPKWGALITATIYIVLSGTRSTAAGLLLFAFTSRNQRAIVAAVAILGLFTVWAVTWGDTSGRLSISGIEQSAGVRVDNITGDESTHAVIQDALGNDVVHTPSRLKPFGYGWGGYLMSTGLQRPHNVAAMLIWELGLLAIIPITVFIWAVWRRLLTLPVVLGFGVVWMLSDDLASRPEAQYMLAAVVLFSLLQRRKGIEDENAISR